RRRHRRDGAVHRPGRAVAAMDADPAAADGGEQGVRRPVRHRGRRAVAGAARRRYCLTKTVLPVIAGHAVGASSHGTTASTTGARSAVAESVSRISGITALALTRPVTNLTPRVYICSSGSSTGAVKMPVSVHTPSGQVARSADCSVAGS